jgi:hypothetical protein
MAIRRSVAWISQLRVDVPDMRSMESAVRSDFDEMIESLVTGENLGYVVRGFEINMVGANGNSANGLSVVVADSAILHTTSLVSGTIFKVAAGTPVEILSSTVNTKVSGSFAPSSTNYVSIDFSRAADASTQAPRAIWDPTNKIETSKVLPVAELMNYIFKINTTGFAADTLPMAVVQTDAANNVTSITDRRPMLFRLGTAGFSSPNPSYKYPWTNQPEGRVENPPTSTSSANPFHGGDKQIKSQKEWMDAVMSIIQEITGGIYWYSLGTGGSITGIRSDGINTVATGRATITHASGTPGKLNWDFPIRNRVLGSRLTYVVSSYAAGSDMTLVDGQVAYVNLVRNIGIIPNLIFTNSSAVVNSVGAIAWTTDLIAGDYIKIDGVGDEGYYEIFSVDSSSQVTLTIVYGGTSTGPSGIKAKYAFGVYNVVGAPSTDRHVRTALRELVPITENMYWLYFRDDNGGATPKIYTRFKSGEIEQGESQQVSDNTAKQVLDFIGSTSESDSSPQYTSNVYVADGTALTTAISALDAALGALNWKAPVANYAALPAVSNVNGDVRLVLDTRTAYSWRSSDSTWIKITSITDGIKVIGGGTISWTAPNLTFTTDMYLEIKGLAYSDNTIAFSTQSPIALATTLDVAYIVPNLVTGGPSLTVVVSSLASVPANAIIIARREGTTVIVGTSSTKLLSGQSTTLYAQASDQTLTYMGAPDTADSTPAYSSDIRGTAAENLTARLGSLTNSMGDSQEDRSALFRSDLPVTWTGSQILFTSDIVLTVLNTKSGTVKTATILVANSPISLTDGQMAYITIDRTLASENLTPTIASSTPAQLQANKDIIILAYRKDVSGAGYLHLPLHKQVMNPGQTVRLGASGSGSGTGGAGDDINVLTFKASFKDDFSDIPSTSNSAVDITAGFTDSAAYSAAKALYQLSYDATQTVTGTATAMTLSAAPAFTVKVGDILRVGSEAKKITVLGSINSDGGSGTPFTISSAFTVDPSASAATVSQAVYTKDINNLSVDGLAISTAFSTSIGQILVSYEDSSTVGDDIFDANTTPVIAYTASSDGTLYSDVKVRPTNLTDSEAMVNLPSSSTNLYLRFFSNKTTGSGTVNILGYRAFLHRDISYADGSLLNQAYCFTDGIGTEINCSAPTVVTGKTRLTVTFTYPVAVNAGTTNGSIKVYLNGQKIPRFVDATLTPDASYKEISTSTIELDGDYSALNYSLEVIQDVAVVDSSETNSAAINLVNDSKLRNELMNGGFDLWQRGTSVTVANTISTYLADRWYVKNSLGTNGIITYSQVAGVQVGSKFGAKVQITTAPTAAQVNGTELYQVIENMNTLPLLDKIMSSRIYIKSLGLVNQVGIQFYYKTTEAKVDTALGSEALVTVNTSTFTLGQLLGQSINNLPTSAGVLGIRIRITGVSSGNLYDINNGFVVEQAMMNVGISSLLFKRRGDSIREEIEDCQRYYEKTYDLDIIPGTASAEPGLVGGVGFATNVLNSNLIYKITKRIIPALIIYAYDGTSGTVSVYDTSGNMGATGATPNKIGQSLASGIRKTGGTNFTVNQSYWFQYTADAEI